jgi:hypothetical protein
MRLRNKLNQISAEFIEIRIRTLLINAIIVQFWIWLKSVLRIWDPGSGAFLTPGSGIRNRFIPDPGSRILDPKHIFLRA